MNDERTTVRFVDQMIADAVERRASDIHLQPDAEQFRLRLRVDGILRDRPGPPPHLAERVAARIKLLAGMDVAERRRPQDGRMQGVDRSGVPVQFRVAACPSVHGEKLVLRWVAQNGPQELDALGLPATARNLFIDALENPEGLILVTGPTGSGKSATLQAALRHLNLPERNICTAEDPVEQIIPGTTQLAVNRRAGVDFAQALRAFLRQDPDVIMVGEIRDAETASMAVKAAQTGHLVLSTLHTRSAAAAVERLAQMGIPAYDLAASLTLVVAQRLVRRLCPHCRGTQRSAGRVALVAEPTTAYDRDTSDCSACEDGFSGRLGLFEVVPITAEISDAILAGAASRELAARAAAAGFEDLATAGQRLVEDGLTTAHELHRASQEVHL